MTDKTDKNSQSTTSGAQSQTEHRIPDNNTAAVLLFLASGIRKMPTVPLGEIVATANAVAQIPEAEIRKALIKHALGYWGEVCEEDRKENDLSLKEGFRLLSVYTTSTGTKFWIITEADRSVTTVLMPKDY